MQPFGKPVARGWGADPSSSPMIQSLMTRTVVRPMSLPQVLPDAGQSNRLVIIATDTSPTFGSSSTRYIDILGDYPMPIWQIAIGTYCAICMRSLPQSATSFLYRVC
jgi:hypothetical protein